MPKHYILSEEKEEVNAHFSFCMKDCIPFIRIYPTKGKYVKMEFDMFTVMKNERFVIINYTDHLLPLYDAYISIAQIPVKKKQYIGGGRNAVFTLLAQDTALIAERLYVLLLELHKMDEIKFNEHPFLINKEGFNSEGVHVEKFRNSLSKLPLSDLEDQLHIFEMDNPNQKQTIAIYNEEIESKRKKAQS